MYEKSYVNEPVALYKHPSHHQKNYHFLQVLSKTGNFSYFYQIYYIKLFGVLDFVHLSTPPESKLATGLLWEKQTSFSTRQIGQIVTAYNSKTYRLQTILQYFLTFRKKYRQKNKMISTPCQYWILIVGLKTTSAASSSRCPQRRKWQPIHCAICAEWRAARHGFVTMTNAQ